jgi:hypothetical protein
VVEHWITLLCVYMGSILYAVLISNVSSIVLTLGMGSRMLQEKVSRDDAISSEESCGCQPPAALCDRRVPVASPPTGSGRVLWIRDEKWRYRPERKTRQYWRGGARE